MNGRGQRTDREAYAFIAGGSRGPAPSHDSANQRGPKGEPDRTAIIHRPEPVRVQLNRRNQRYPFHEMDPDDYFIVPLNGDDPEKVVNRMASAGYYHCRMYAPHLTVCIRRVKAGVKVSLVEKEEGAA